ncbi:MAG: NlpC/P60 family protein [Jiangellaceae bacterium]
MPERDRRNTSPRRTLVALCTAAVTTIGGLTLAPVGHADPQLTLEEVRTKVDDLNHKAEQAAERYNAATDELAEIQRRLEGAAANVERQQIRVNELTADMGGFAAASYRAGGIDPTLNALMASDPADFLAQASVVDAYANQQADQLAAVAVQRQRLEQDRLLADEELGRLEAVEADLAEQQAVVERHLADAQELLDGLEAEERAQLDAERAERARAAAADRASRGGGSDESLPDVPASGRAKIAVDFALAQLGEPYQWGAEGPGSWDCSGLTMMAWREAGVSLPRSSAAQIGVGTRVSKSQLQPGDLVFFYSPISHVGIYLGGGDIVHATHPGDVVSIDPLAYMPFSGATRPG